MGWLLIMFCLLIGIMVGVMAHLELSLKVKLACNSTSETKGVACGVIDCLCMCR